MNICDHGHEEIVHESRNCPLCENIEELEIITTAYNKLQSEQDKLEEQYSEFISLVEKTNPELLI